MVERPPPPFDTSLSEQAGGCGGAKNGSTCIHPWNTPGGRDKARLAAAARSKGEQGQEKDAVEPAPGPIEVFKLSNDSPTGD